MTTGQQQIKVPQEFFRKVRRDYRNWKQATIRELVQNSVDAGATKIDLTIGFSYGTNHLVLGCKDNGRGMTRDCLENVFMVLGGSRKEEGSLGGFGMAKMVIFSADHYMIASGVRCVQGQGSEYTVSTVPHCDGVFTMLDYQGESPDDWRNQIRVWAGKCCLKGVTLTLNGEELPQDQGGYEFVDKASGAVYKMNGQDFSTVTWCSKGLAMFTETYWSEGNSNVEGRIELGPLDPVQTFTTNRDAFRTEKGDWAKTTVNMLVQTHKTRTKGDTIMKVANYSAPWSGEETRKVGRVETGTLPENFHIRVDGYTQRRNAKVAAYTNAAELTKFLDGRNAGKLAHQWANACRIVLSTGLALDKGVTCYKAQGTATDWDLHGDEVSGTEHYLEGQRIEMGFGFVPGAEALCMAGQKILYLNPWALPEDLLLMDLIDLALHEVTHL